MGLLSTAFLFLLKFLVTTHQPTFPAGLWLLAMVSLLVFNNVGYTSGNCTKAVAHHFIRCLPRINNKLGKMECSIGVF